MKEIYNNTGKKCKLYQRIGLGAYYYDGQVSATVDNEGNSVCMNEELFYRLKPLVELQDYIQSFEMWKGEKVDMDYDRTRDSKTIPLPCGTIHSWGETIFPETSTDLSEPWLTVQNRSVASSQYKDKVLINRTQRYQNPYITYFFLKEHQDKIVFSGTEGEYSDFCTRWDLQIEHLKTDNFYQLASILQWVKFGIFNQSLHFHIADAIKTKRILELCPQYPNSFITGANGSQFYHQTSLEYHFNRLIK